MGRLLFPCDQQSFQIEVICGILHGHRTDVTMAIDLSCRPPLADADSTCRRTE